VCKPHLTIQFWKVELDVVSFLREEKRKILYLFEFVEEKEGN